MRGVIDGRGPARVLGDECGDLLRAFAGRGVDDARTGRLAEEFRQQVLLLLLALGTLHFVEEVGAGEAGDEGLRVVQRQLLDDVAADAVRGGGGQGDGRRVAQQLAEIAEPGVIGAKIVPPLADAVCLVDGQQLQIHAADRLEEPPAAKPLRRHVHQPEPARGHLVEPLVLLGRGQRAVDERDRQAERFELIDLVLHQGDQRRDDQRQSLQDHGRQLVAEAFSPSGGHDAEAIPPGQDRRNHLLLAMPERRKPKERQVRFEIIGRQFGHRSTRKPNRQTQVHGALHFGGIIIPPPLAAGGAGHASRTAEDIDPPGHFLYCPSCRQSILFAIFSDDC